MAALTSLPTELFWGIIEIMKGGDCDGSVAALAATCRSFYDLTMPCLYDKIAIRHPCLIFWAALYGQLATAKRLVADGARLDLAMQWNRGPRGPFRKFYSRRTPAQVYRAFQTLGAVCKDVEQSKDHWFPIHLAAMNGSVDMVELFIRSAPQSLNASSYRLCGCRAAALHPERDVLPQETCDRWMPLHLAACHNRDQVLRRLLEQGSSTQTGFCTARVLTRSWSSGDGSSTALHAAARFGLVDMIPFILDGGYQTDVHVLDGRGLSPIWHAYLHGQSKAVDILLARGANIDDHIGYGYTPLMDACLRTGFSGAAELIDRGANVSVEYFAAPGTRCDVPELTMFHWAGLRPIDFCCRLSSQLPQQFEFDSPSRTSWFEFDSTFRTWWPVSLGHENGLKKEDSCRRAALSKLLASGVELRASPALPNYPPPLVAAAANQ
ncbi:hypothetical protein VTK56DRAFT_9811 [Thermocarpiscus australiensis]